MDKLASQTSIQDSHYCSYPRDPVDNTLLHIFLTTFASTSPLTLFKLLLAAYKSSFELYLSKSSKLCDLLFAQTHLQTKLKGAHLKLKTINDNNLVIIITIEIICI